MSEKFVTLDILADKMRLKCLTPEIDLKKIKIDRASIHRPALQLTGYYDYFDTKRLEIVGRAEYEYTKTLSPKVRAERFDRLCSFRFPGVIMARGLVPDPSFLAAARKYGIPVFSTEKETAYVIITSIQFLSEMLAPTDTVYGVLVDVYGEGIIITGKSGIGKSETAIELVKRGHRLVADDLIEIKKINEDILFGSAPSLTKYLIELRGIGVVDAKSLFGLESVKESTQINMIINLEEWDESKTYDRLGLSDEFQTILDVPVVKHNVPVRPGRNLAIIVETAAVNNRQKKMGYNTAEQLCETVSQHIKSINEQHEPA